MGYGADGLSYCNSCIFYGLNRPCWKCQMYLPISELQPYKGQWACPYCITDMRDEDRRAERSYGQQGKELNPTYTQERCERCGTTLSVVYYYNGKRLCGTCAEQEKDKGERKGSERPPMVVYRIKEKGRASSIVSSIGQKIDQLIRRKKTDEAEKKEEKKSKKEERKNVPMSEELAKTSGIKYELATYKDLEFDKPEKAKKPKERKKKGKKKGKR